MMPPGHVAVTWGVASLLQRNNPGLARLDYRLLGLCALAPDLIDKPLAILVFTGAHTSQLITHSLLFNVVLLALALLWWRRALPYVLAFSSHLVADRMWHHTESFWWPLFGWNNFWEYKVMNTAGAMLSVYWDIVTRYPQVWAVEAIAIGFFVWFAAANKLYLWPVLAKFILTGRLESSREAMERAAGYLQDGQAAAPPSSGSG
jgi:hypothetical protein